MQLSLTAKQQRFVGEYMVDCNATAAAIRAGYSEKGARVRGSELLANRNVSAAVTERQLALQEKCEITSEKVLADIKRIADHCMAIGDNRNALRALYLLGKHLGLFTNRVEHSVQTVHINIADRIIEARKRAEIAVNNSPEEQPMGLD